MKLGSNSKSYGKTFVSLNVAERFCYILKFVPENLVIRDNGNSLEKNKLLDNFANKALLLTKIIQTLNINVDSKNVFILC